MYISLKKSLMIAQLALLGAYGSGAGAAEVECEFEPNSQWPGEHGRTCQDDTVAPLPLLSEDQSTFSAWPTCVSSSADPDGDGWGWEDFRSCRVAEPVRAGLDPLSRFPVCVSDTDPDRDGWGWENFRSCRVAEPVAATSDQFSRFPVCVGPTADPDGDGWGWENLRSCRANTTQNVVTTPPVTTTPDTSTDNDSTNIADTGSQKSDVQEKANTSPSVIYQQDFEASTLGLYTPQQLNTEWDSPLWHLGVYQGRTKIVNDSRKGQALEVTFPANEFGAAGASAFLSDLAFGIGFEGHYDELYVSYDMKFAEGFDFVRGGKLPGLCGYNMFQRPGDGCNTGGGFPSGYDGWSARGMWREDGFLENYVYNPSQRSYYGDEEHWNVQAIPGQWHQVQHRVVMNTVGQKNGILEAWFDGNKVLSDDNYEYRKTDNVKINLFYFSTFYGGNDPSWAPSTDQFVYFDNFRISTTPLEGTEPDLKLGFLQDETTNQTSTGGGAFFGPVILLLALLRRRFI